MRPIAFHPQIARELGNDIESALFYQQIYYWRDKGVRSDGFIYKTIKQIEDETILTRHQQDRVREKLIRLGWIEVKKIKVNGAPTLHYKPLVEVSLICRKPANGNAGNRQFLDLPETGNSSIQRLPKSTTSEAIASDSSFKKKKEPTLITKAESEDLIARLDTDFGASDEEDLIGAYLNRRKVVFKTKEAFREAVNRHRKIAKTLVASFTTSEIIRGMDIAQRKFEEEWTLETVLKVLTK